MKRITRITIPVILSCLILSGCANSIKLSSEHSDIIAEYAAGALLKYSYDYKSRYKDLGNDVVYEPETESPTTEPATQPATTPGNNEETTSGNDNTNNWNISKDLGLGELTIEYKKYVITSEYPNDSSAMFSFTAQEGYTFIVFNFDITNKGTQDVLCNNSDDEKVVTLNLNGNTYYNNYANLMLNDITYLKNVTIKAGETQDGILVFMVPEDKVTEIKSIVLTYKDCKLTVK